MSTKHVVLSLSGRLSLRALQRESLERLASKGQKTAASTTSGRLPAGIEKWRTGCPMRRPTSADFRSAYSIASYSGSVRNSG